MEFVPAKKKIAGWDGPDSLCDVYFTTCAKLGCTANSEVVRQLVRRARLLAPLPTHRVEGKSRLEMLHMAFDHMDLDGNGTLSISELVSFARGLNPIKVHGDVKAMIRQMDKDGDNVISREEYVDAMRPISDSLVDEEFKLGILETLSSKPDLNDLSDRESKLAAVFRHLDQDCSDSLDAEELIAIFMDDAEPDPAAARRNALKQLEWLDTDSDGVVSQTEFTEAMLFMYSYMSDEDFHAQCVELVGTKKHLFDFSRAMLGAKGVEAVLPALQMDKAFTHLSFRGCGVRNATCTAIREALQGHANLRYLDLGGNPISVGGVSELTQLVKNTKSLVDLRFDGCHFVREFSDVSVDLEDVTEDRLTFNALLNSLSVTRLPPPPSSEEEIAAMDVDQFLYQRRHSVKKMFQQIAGDDGKISFDELRDGVMSLSEDWGAVLEHVVKFISPERIFGKIEGIKSSDLDGDGTLSYAEFTRALQKETTRVKVINNCKRRRVQLKVVFYALAGDGGFLTLQQLMDGIESVLVEQAHDFWGFTVEEMRSVINAEMFRDLGSGEILDSDDGIDNALTWGEFYTRLAGMT